MLLGWRTVTDARPTAPARMTDGRRSGSGVGAGEGRGQAEAATGGPRRDRDRARSAPNRIRTTTGGTGRARGEQRPEASQHPLPVQHAEGRPQRGRGVGQGHPGVHGMRGPGRPGQVVLGPVPVPGGHFGVRASTEGREEVEGVVQGELGRPEHQDHDVEARLPAAEQQDALRGQGEEQERERARPGQTSARRAMARGTEGQARRTAEQAPGRSPRQATRCTHGDKAASRLGRPGAGCGVRLGAAVSSHGAVVGRMAEKVPAAVRLRKGARPRRLRPGAGRGHRDSAGRDLQGRHAVASPTADLGLRPRPGGLFRAVTGGAVRPPALRWRRAVTGISFCPGRGAGTLVGSPGGGAPAAAARRVRRP